jgi:putative Mn2+ efflux pump MntP
MHTKLKHFFWAFALLACFPLYSLGQLWIFQSQRNGQDFATQLTTDTASWINAHLLLMLGIMLMIPAYLAISNYVRETKGKPWLDWSTLFLGLGTFVLFGQFTIDLLLPTVFASAKEQGYIILEQTQENPIIKACFYENGNVFFLFKYIDVNLFAQLFLGIGLYRSKKVPKWALVIYLIALLATQMGMALGPVYGRIIKRSGYALFSASFLPIAWYYLQTVFSNRTAE